MRHHENINCRLPLQRDCRPTIQYDSRQERGPRVPIKTNFFNFTLSCNIDMKFKNEFI